jgi:hypothetical protein
MLSAVNIIHTNSTHTLPSTGRRQHYMVGLHSMIIILYNDKLLNQVDCVLSSIKLYTIFILETLYNLKSETLQLFHYNK